ncbi:cytochrome-c peroxidase [Algibacter mikhailovii]|uniref:Cytochrome-c peroxidase n=1 Tax=Algibacter mikhailovii TaxID=425498 RepID=A0A918VAE0_9FLAO|nr:cytochrome c peroxidase [Algibacter mikhailovii]GGZ84866.1 cytochrome-c peroxidase [Algibacter mikhailovii]
MKHWNLYVLLFLILSCSNDNQEIYVQTPQPLNIPILFEENILAPVIPINNPQTAEGIALGKKLFFDPILSGDESQACADCHAPEQAFTDVRRFSEGIDGTLGKRNSMPLFNLAWNYDEKFFWDGSSFSLEHQAFIPVSDPTEMKNTWTVVEQKLQNHKEYPTLFTQAFGSSKIDSIAVTKAIAQFERTLISSNSKFDQYLLNKIELTAQELNGFNIFMDEARGDCFHCHGSDKNPLWTDNIFHNNGLDETFIDLGLGNITGDPSDNGKFKTPSLRNLAFTAPFMHDGRFTTIEAVIDHYSEGLKNSETIDPLMKKVDSGGIGLTPQDKADLKAFLLTLTDFEFINNSAFHNQ